VFLSHSEHTHSYSSEYSVHLALKILSLLSDERAASPWSKFRFAIYSKINTRIQLEITMNIMPPCFQVTRATISKDEDHFFELVNLYVELEFAVRILLLGLFDLCFMV
jgi:hypothetical protein